MRKGTIERRGKIKDLDRSFDLQFWQAQPASLRFQATWELIQPAWKVKGHDVRQLRLQRSVENIQRQSRFKKASGRPQDMIDADLLDSTPQEP